MLLTIGIDDNVSSEVIYCSSALLKKTINHNEKIIYQGIKNLYTE